MLYQRQPATIHPSQARFPSSRNGGISNHPRDGGPAILYDDHAPIPKYSIGARLKYCTLWPDPGGHLASDPTSLLRRLRKPRQCQARTVRSALLELRNVFLRYSTVVSSKLRMQQCRETSSGQPCVGATPDESGVWAFPAWGTRELLKDVSVLVAAV